MNNKALNRAKIKRDDEYYTTREQLDFIFSISGFIPKDTFKDKIVYLPFDTDDSEITKYFIEKRNELKYKKLINTSDNYQKHHDLFLEADIVFSNIPFSLTQDILDYFEAWKIQFIVFVAKNIQCRQTIIPYLYDGRFKILIHDRFTEFTRPDGSKKEVAWNLLSNIDSVKTMRYAKDNMRIFEKSYKYIQYDRDDDYNLAIFKEKRNIPYDYADKFWTSPIGLPVLLDKLEVIVDRPIRIKVSGKTQFASIMVRIRPEILKQNLQKHGIEN